MDKNIPIISQLLRLLILENYDEALELVKSDKFNPNGTNTSWHAPVLSAVISVLSNAEKSLEKEGLKTVMKEIAKHKDLDPNIIDAEGETIIMHIARHPQFNWFAPFLMNNQKLDISIKNFMHKDAIDIAFACGNQTLADILLPLKMKGCKGLPKKRVGVKKTIKFTKPTEVNGAGRKNILDRIEKAFDPDKKKNPVSLYALLTSFFLGEYSTCIQIVKDVNFNPNECDRWEEPALSSLIYYSQDAHVTYNEEMFKKIVDAFIQNKRFNVNALDADCNTILMVAMGFPKLKWLTEKLFNIQSARLDVINDSGETIRQIADNCGNGEFYNHLVRKSFETADVVS